MPKLRGGEWLYDEGEQAVVQKDVEARAEDRPGHRPLSSYNLPKWVYHPQQTKRRIYVEKQDFHGMAADGTRNYEGWNVAHVACFHDDLKMLSLATLEECKEANKWGMTPAHMCGLGVHQYGPSVHTLYELVEMGAANPDALNLGEQTPYNVAQRMHKQANLRLFSDILVKGKKPADHDAKKGAALKPRGKFAKALRAGSPKTCLLLPGPESAYAGMLKDLVEAIPAVQQLFSKAEEVLGYDVKPTVLNGPMEELQKPKFLLPAIYIACLAAVEKLVLTDPDAVEDCFAVMGLSVSEYAALTVAGVFGFEVGLGLVKVRAEALAVALDATPQKGLSVAGLSKDVLERVCKEEGAAKGKVCQLSQHLFPTGFSITGDADAIAAAQSSLQAAEAKQVHELATPSIHNSRMSKASTAIREYLEQKKEEMQPPRCRLYLNATGTSIEPQTPVADIVEHLATQVVSPVLWNDSVTAAIKDGCTKFIECGPNDQLYQIMRLISPQAHKEMLTLHV